MQDKFNRSITYLRLSVTDRCNLRCFYCLPEEGVPLYARKSILSFEEIVYLSKIFHTFGIKKVRLTGGEPLVRRGIEDLIRKLKDELPDLELTLTTNGFFLKELGCRLKSAGLDRINVSLDSLNQFLFYKLTRGGNLKRVLSGIKSALKMGFPLKLNTVVLKNINDGEILDLIDFAFENDIKEIRFIEFMPLSGPAWNENLLVREEEIKSEIEKRYKLDSFKKDEVAVLYKLRNAEFRIGFISSVSHPFCDTCSRIRITATGGLRPCLFSSLEIPLAPYIRGKRDKLPEVIQNAIYNKPIGSPFFTKDRIRDENVFISKVGG